jgi:hypothetical protein
MSDIHEKLRKLLALAQQGIGGEKENAQSRLESLMKKHGVTIDEIGEESREMQWFKPERGTFEKRLMLQVLAAVCGNVSTWRCAGKRGQIGVKVTKSEQLEINLRYDAYVVAMKKEMAICYSAFVQTNKIFHADAPHADESEVDMVELTRIALAMMGMSRVPIRRTLSA